MSDPKIIYEDGNILVVDKPPGWIVNKADTTKNQPVLQDWLEGFDYPLSKDHTTRSGIVHRLDKETSGVLIVAKDKESMEDLQMQFKKRLVKKTYIALLHGKMEPNEGSVNVPVGRLPWSRKKFGVIPGGRESYTEFKVVKYYKKDNDIFTLCEFYPKTGRTHQIRIHSKYLNHSIIADENYAGRKTAKKDRVWCPRIFLHAKEIEFSHPVKKNKMKISSKLPSDLNKALSVLEIQA